MADQDYVNVLAKLAQLDIDAIHAYDQAISNIDDQNVRVTLTRFQEDHKRHVTELSREIKNMGGDPPEGRDFKGFLIEGFTAIRSLTGTIGALKAMQGNEELTTRTYREALDKDDLPVILRGLVERNYADEQRHLSYVKATLHTLENLEKVE